MLSQWPLMLLCDTFLGICLRTNRNSWVFPPSLLHFLFFLIVFTTVAIGSKNVCILFSKKLYINHMVSQWFVYTSVKFVSFLKMRLMGVFLSEFCSINYLVLHKVGVQYLLRIHECMNEWVCFYFTRLDVICWKCTKTFTVSSLKETTLKFGWLE